MSTRGLGWWLLALSLLAGVAAAEPYREVRLVMGSVAEVRLDGAPDARAAADAAFAALDRVDQDMSLWHDSALTRLNAAGEAEVSAELMAVLHHALDVARVSGGAFDPTVEPLVRAAGHLGERRRTLSAVERQTLLRRVGYDRVTLLPDQQAVRLQAGTRLDLGGIAKGYAADLALVALRQAGTNRAVVNLGQSSWAVFGDVLQIEVRDPSGAPQPLARFRLQDAAASTSGGDQRPGHILDPRTGRPARIVLAATVVAASAMEADALSSAVYVLGARDGLALLRRRGAAGFVLYREAGRLHLLTTPGFRQHYRLEAASTIVVREA